MGLVSLGSAQIKGQTLTFGIQYSDITKDVIGLQRVGKASVDLNCKVRTESEVIERKVNTAVGDDGVLVNLVDRNLKVREELIPKGDEPGEDDPLPGATKIVLPASLSRISIEIPYSEGR